MSSSCTFLWGNHPSKSVVLELLQDKCCVHERQYEIKSKIYIYIYIYNRWPERQTLPLDIWSKHNLGDDRNTGEKYLINFSNFAPIFRWNSGQTLMPWCCWQRYRGGGEPLLNSALSTNRFHPTHPQSERCKAFALKWIWNSYCSLPPPPRHDSPPLLFCSRCQSWWLTFLPDNGTEWTAYRFVCLDTSCCMLSAKWHCCISLHCLAVVVAASSMLQIREWQERWENRPHVN